MVDLPAPTPLQGIGASQQPLPRTPGQASEKVSKPVIPNSPPQIVSVAKQLASGPAPLDHARIAQIKAAISSGNYRADPDEIARALLGNG